MSSDALPDDPETLKAMLLAERVQNDRLRQIIKELQRQDQMLLGLEESSRPRRTVPRKPMVHRPRTTGPG
jgi:hypothetical protein